MRAPKLKTPLASSENFGDDQETPQVVTGETNDTAQKHWLRQPSVNAASTAQQQPQQTPRQEYLPFAMVLRQAMLDKNLSASEVARRVWGTSKDKRGYEVAKNRDRVGHYLAGTSYPEPDNLQKLADALEVPVERLGIGNRPRPITREPRSVKETILSSQLQPDDVQLFFVGGDLSAARLLVNRTIRAELAMQIIKMLREDENAGKDAANPMHVKLPHTE